MNARQARTKGYDAGCRSARRAPFNAVSELLAVDALKDALPKQDAFSRSVVGEIPPRRLVLLHAYRMGVAHGIADTIKNRRK